MGLDMKINLPFTILQCHEHITGASIAVLFVLMMQNRNEKRSAFCQLESKTISKERGRGPEIFLHTQWLDSFRGRKHSP
jgi:hypothetical protein